MTEGIRKTNFFLFISTNESKKVADYATEDSDKSGLWYELESARTRATQKGIQFKEICILREGDGPPLYFGQKRYLDLRDDAKYRSQLNELVIQLKYGRYKPSFPARDVTWTIGNLRIPDIVPELPFLKEKALSLARLRCKYENIWTPLPDHLLAAQKLYIQQKQSETLGRYTFDNNLSYYRVSQVH